MDPLCCWCGSLNQLNNDFKPDQITYQICNALEFFILNFNFPQMDEMEENFDQLHSEHSHMMKLLEEERQKSQTVVQNMETHVQLQVLYKLLYETKRKIISIDPLN